MRNKRKRRGLKREKGDSDHISKKGDIIYYYHTDVSDSGGDSSSDSRSSNNEVLDLSEPSSSGSSDSESESSESKEEIEKEVDGGICPRNCAGDPGEMFTLCPKCGALKLKALLIPIHLPRELSLTSLCSSDGRKDTEEKNPPQLPTLFLLFGVPRVIMEGFLESM